MALSINGIPFGSQATSKTSAYEATKTIVSDGKVDEAFTQPGESFISSITDSRVQGFLKDNTAPGPEWKEHELGGYDSDTQSLFVENEKVVLRSNTKEKGKTIRHLIQAPYDADGTVNLQSSTEGYNFAEKKSSGPVFKIPL